MQTIQDADGKQFKPNTLLRIDGRQPPVQRVVSCQSTVITTLHPTDAGTDGGCAEEHLPLCLGLIVASSCFLTLIICHSCFAYMPKGTPLLFIYNNG